MYRQLFTRLKYLILFLVSIKLQVLGLITFIVGIVARVNGSFGILDAHIPAVHAGNIICIILSGFF